MRSWFEKLKEKKKPDIRQYFRQLGILLFFGLMLFIAFVGLLFPLRPDKSKVEKRTLTKFPRPTAESFFDGEFTGQISIWYADTFPFREPLMKLNSKFHKFYGLSGEAIHGETAKNDEIPKDGKLIEKPKITEKEEAVVDAAIRSQPEQIGSVYVAGETGFSTYGFDSQAVSDYVRLLNRTAEVLGDSAKVYDIVVPTAIGINLSEEMQEKVGSANQKEALGFIESNLSKQVQWIPVFDTLKKHNSEYLYFRTDHHWTADAAYYAYCEYMRKREVMPSPLSDYTKVEYPGFIGSYYAYSDQSETFRKHPDTVSAYIPQANDMVYVDEDGNEWTASVVGDATEYSEENKYLCFISGDMPYARIDNPNLTDGSSCLVIKESYGNAFVPFLVNNYQTVHVADYRYYNGNLLQFIRDHQIQDVIFVNNTNALNENAVWLMDQILIP